MLSSSLIDEAPPDISPSWDEQYCTRFMDSAFINPLKKKFQNVTANAKGLQTSLNQLIEPVLNYLADLQVNNSTRMVSGLVVTTRSLKGLNILLTKQKKFFESDFVPCLTDKIAFEVRSALACFENDISQWIKKVYAAEAAMFFKEMHSQEQVFNGHAFFKADFFPEFCPTAPAEQIIPHADGECSRLVSEHHLRHLQDSFYQNIVEAKGLRFSINNVLAPLVEYLADLQVHNSSQDITGIKDKTRSLKKLIQLFEQQEQIFKKDYEPFLSKNVSIQVVDALDTFKNSIFSYLQDFLPLAVQKHRAEMREVKDTICSARGRQSIDILGMISCFLWCPVELCCSVCFALCHEGRVPREDRILRTGYVLFPPGECIKDFHDDFTKQNTIISKVSKELTGEILISAPKSQRMV